MSSTSPYTGVIRRLVNLPRSLIGGLTAARPPPHFPPPPPPNYYHPSPPPNYYHPPPPQTDQWEFLSLFESFYGHTHPFFYACSFNQALRIGREEGKLLLVYLHYPDPSNPFTASFCRDTLGSDLAVQFVDANFVSWGGLADRGEGLEMARLLRPPTFPFCAVVAPAATHDSVTVLQQIEGPVSPAELVEILQRTMEDQGVAFGSSRAIEEEKRRADRRLREEQDAAYFAALKIDQERERAKNRPKSAEKPTPNVGKPFSVISSQRPIKASRVKESTTSEIQHRSSSTKGKATSVAQILVKFPNGERLEHSFSSSDKVRAIFEYIDSLGLGGVGNYRLVASFPRKVYGADEKNMRLKDAGLYPKATLFLEPL